MFGSIALSFNFSRLMKFADVHLKKKETNCSPLLRYVVAHGTYNIERNTNSNFSRNRNLKRFLFV